MAIPTSSEVWRKYVTDGIPASGANEPDKTQIVQWGMWLEALIQAGIPGLAYATRDNLIADLAHGANSTAVVYGDATTVNNGFYVKSGASGSGSWSRIGDLPNVIVPLTVTGGTANAIVASAPETPLAPGLKLFVMTPTANNTAATTLSYNGQPALPIKSAFGNALIGGELLNASPIMMLGASDHFTLLLSTNVDASGILAAAVAAQSAAASSATAAANSATTAQNYALAANPINRPAFGPIASPWPYAIGDSLFTNAHVTTALPNMIATAMGWGSITTNAVSGSTIADQASIYGFQRTPNVANPALVWLGTNDVILDSSDNRTTEQTSLEGLRALLFHLAIPTAKRVTGQAMTTAAGTWTNISTALDPGGSFSNNNGAVKRGVVTGRHVVVAGWANTVSNGVGAVSIGNNTSADVLSDTLTFKRTILTNSPGGTPTTTIPFVRVYKNVGVDDDSKITVSVANVSAGGAGNEIYIGYVAGLTGKQDEAMPLVMCSNLHNFSSTGETAQGTSAARRDRFNWAIANIIDEMMGLGLWAVPVDAKSVLWDTTLLDTDGVHPINAGNTVLTTAWQTAINAAQAYYHKRNSQLSLRGVSDTFGSDILPRGRFVSKDFKWMALPRNAVGSGFSAHNNNVNQSVSDGGTPAALSFSAEIYDVNGDFTSSTWSPPAGQIVIRAAATFTAGVDGSPYELYVYKNGSAFKRLTRVIAKGTGEFQIGGEMFDMAADGDTYVIRAFQNSGGAATVDGQTTKTYFMGYSAN